MEEVKAIKNMVPAYDKSNMYDVLKGFPEQVKLACKIGKEAPLFKNGYNPRQVMILGMGGSAIGGDILRSYSAAIKGADHLSIQVNRGYNLPGYVGENTYVIASSYSGGTEETLNAFEEARKNTQHLIGITSGGELAEKLVKYDLPAIKIPGGLQPRCALGFSFFPMLHVMMRSGAYDSKATKETEEALDELIPALEKKSALYSELNDDNPALLIAKKLAGKVPVVYSSSVIMDSVNLRLRCQVQENAKNACFGNLLPEMNHNEINGWSYPLNFKAGSIVILIKDVFDHERVKIRFEALEEVLTGASIEVIKMESDYQHLLTRMFDLIYFGDWVSYYMALLNKTDPTPIPLIIKLKNILASR